MDLWRQEEVDALEKAVLEYGRNWKTIMQDPYWAAVFANRTESAIANKYSKVFGGQAQKLKDKKRKIEKARAEEANRKSTAGSPRRKSTDRPGSRIAAGLEVKDEEEERDSAAGTLEENDEQWRQLSREFARIVPRDRKSLEIEDARDDEMQVFELSRELGIGTGEERVFKEFEIDVGHAELLLAKIATMTDRIIVRTNKLNELSNRPENFKVAKVAFTWRDVAQDYAYRGYLYLCLADAPDQSSALSLALFDLNKAIEIDADSTKLILRAIIFCFHDMFFPAIEDLEKVFADERISDSQRMHASLLRILCLLGLGQDLGAVAEIQFIRSSTGSEMEKSSILMSLEALEKIVQAISHCPRMLRFNHRDVNHPKRFSAEHSLCEAITDLLEAKENVSKLTDKSDFLTRCFVARLSAFIERLIQIVALSLPESLLKNLFNPAEDSNPETIKDLQ